LWSSEATPDVYIVRFNEYKMAAEHKEDVTRHLGRGTGSWSWIDRDNRAMAFPTDFGLLQLAADTLQASSVRAYITTEMGFPSTVMSLFFNCESL